MFLNVYATDDEILARAMSNEFDSGQVDETKRQREIWANIIREHDLFQHNLTRDYVANQPNGYVIDTSANSWKR